MLTVFVCLVCSSENLKRGIERSSTDHTALPGQLLCEWAGSRSYQVPGCQLAAPGAASRPTGTIIENSCVSLQLYRNKAW